MASDEEIGANLSRLRAGRSQKEVAEAMRAHGFKWSQATVWSVEKGERPVRLTEAQALGVVLGIHPDLLLARPDEIDLHADVAEFTGLLEEIAGLAYESYEMQLRLARSIDDRPEAERAGVTLSIVNRNAVDAVVDGLARADAHHRRVTETGEWLDRRNPVSTQFVDAFSARIREVVGSGPPSHAGEALEASDGIDQAKG